MNPYFVKRNFKLYNDDCVKVMKTFEDNSFDLAIADPPYRDENQQDQKMRVHGDMKDFGGKPNAEYFKELFRVSKNQIIWGGNNFLEHLPNTNCVIWWYKQNPAPNYSDGELAWTSFRSVARCVNLPYYGPMNADQIKFHPTQKPVKLYEWLLKEYGTDGNKILDTHIGSMSIAIACHYQGFDLVGCETNKSFCDQGIDRMYKETAQVSMF